MLITRRTAARLLLAGLLFPATSPAVAETAFDYSTVARTALDAHIRPGFAALVKETRQQEQAAARLCAERSRRALDAARQAFTKLVVAWGRVEHLRFGPLTQENRLERFLFWPDRQGIGGRQVRRLLDQRDMAALENLRGKSVAVQGLGALEIALFGAESDGLGSKDAAADHRCAYALAVTKNLAGLAAEIADAWAAPDGAARDWLEPGPENRHYLTAKETVAELAKAFSTGIERVRDERIVLPLGFGPQRRKEPAVLGLSDRTMALTLANMEGLLALLHDSGLEAETRRTLATLPPIPGGSLDLAVAELKTARQRVADAARETRPFASEKATRALIASGFPLKNARTIFGVLFSEAAGLTLGFNASDGD